eukprot:PhF_6_TR20777/c0_g1_i1/m.29821
MHSQNRVAIHNNRYVAIDAESLSITIHPDMTTLPIPEDVGRVQHLSTSSSSSASVIIGVCSLGAVRISVPATTTNKDGALVVPGVVSAPSLTRIKLKSEVLAVVWHPTLQDNLVALLCKNHTVMLYDVSEGWSTPRLLVLPPASELGTALCCRFLPLPMYSDPTLAIGTSNGVIYTMGTEVNRDSPRSNDGQPLFSLSNVGGVKAMEVVSLDVGTQLTGLMLITDTGAFITALYCPHTRKVSVHSTAPLVPKSPSSSTVVTPTSSTNLKAAKVSMSKVVTAKGYETVVIRIGMNVVMVALVPKWIGGSWRIMDVSCGVDSVPPPLTVLSCPIGVQTAAISGFTFDTKDTGVLSIHFEDSTAKVFPLIDMVGYGTAGTGKEDKRLKKLVTLSETVQEATTMMNSLHVTMHHKHASTMSPDKQMEELCAIVETKLNPLSRVLTKGREEAITVAKAVAAEQEALNQRKVRIHERLSALLKSAENVSKVLQDVEDAAVTVALLQGHGGDPRGVAGGTKAGQALKRNDPSEAVAYVLSGNHRSLGGGS